jgi:hypothetical protein
MAIGRVIRVGLALAVVLTGTACDPGSIDPFDEPQAQTYRNYGGGMWIGNGLEDPGVSGVSPDHALSTKQGLSPDGGVMADADGVDFVTYLVECVLPEGDSITKTRKADGQVFVFEGALGLAPEWKDGACDEDCQQWVSACLLARTNVSGETVGLWLSADHPALGLGHSPDQPMYEATFYGNVFEDPDAQHLCRGLEAGGGLGDFLQGRTCDGQPPAACGFSEWGACGDPDRCIFQNGFATECATGDDPAVGVRFNSISTFVSIDGWQGG